jgi:hypothetical protein
MRARHESLAMRWFPVRNNAVSSRNCHGLRAAGFSPFARKKVPKEVGDILELRRKSFDYSNASSPSMPKRPNKSVSPGSAAHGRFHQAHPAESESAHRRERSGSVSRSGTGYEPSVFFAHFATASMTRSMLTGF